jgi:hypothetical protein
MFSSNTSQVADSAANYIEDVFSTWLYTGNESTQTITNGIDLAGRGGLVWLKGRTSGSVNDHFVFDTARGVNKRLSPNLIDAEQTGAPNSTTGLTAFNANGFTLGDGFGMNRAGQTYVSWTFREQQRFFDVVTYTGNGTAGRTVAHNLGSVPGCIIVKKVSSSDSWYVYHRSVGVSSALSLDSAVAAETSSAFLNGTQPTAENFTLGSQSWANQNGATFVAYLFAHNAGGFGLTGTDNVITCGSYTGNGSTAGPAVNLGYEPQWLMIKNASASAGWPMEDTMRGIVVGGTGRELRANSNNSEEPGTFISPQATGFQLITATSEYNASGNTYIYIAIRRGPMRIPTTGASVLGLSLRNGTSNNVAVSSSAGVTDLSITKIRNSNLEWVWCPRLTGNGYLSSNDIRGEITNSAQFPNNPWDVMSGVRFSTGALTNNSGAPYINYFLDRAPGFMDVVCYTGNNSAGRTLAHNLTVVPELMMVKRRSGNGDWDVWSKSLSASNILYLNDTGASFGSSSSFNSTAPTASVFTLGSSSSTNGGSETYINYLFASCPGVSSVGSYTGNGSSQTINCGFTGGARFVMVRRINNPGGNWMVVDTAQGIVASGDPTLYMNSTSSNVFAIDWIDPASSGFIVNQEETMNANVNGGAYIYLAIA